MNDPGHPPGCNCPTAHVLGCAQYWYERNHSGAIVVPKARSFEPDACSYCGMLACVCGIHPDGFPGSDYPDALLDKPEGGLDK